MGRKHIRPKKHLQFRELLKVLKNNVDKIEDTRDQQRISYSLKDVYTSAFALFYLQDPSLLEFQRRCQDEIQINNLTTVFGVDGIPSDTQLRDVIDKHNTDQLSDIFRDIFYQLQRGKQLESFKFLGDYYLIPFDGSEYFSSEAINCKKCLTKKSRQTIRYHHQILQATLVHPDHREVIPLAPEFIQNGDGEKKQDCELKAGKRLLETVKKDHPQLKCIILGDSLYSKAPFVNLIKEKKMSFILVAKPDDHKSLYNDVEGLREGRLLDRFEKTEKNRTYIYEWTNNVYLNSTPESPQINFCQLTIKKNGKRTFRNAWVTDLSITSENIEEIVRGGRARWKIENEGFNTLKNHGYHLNHNFGHGKNNLANALFLLNLLAFMFHQIFQICDGLYQSTRNCFSSRKEYWNCIGATFRLIIFDSWEQVLERINSPPKNRSK